MKILRDYNQFILNEDFLSGLKNILDKSWTKLKSLFVKDAWLYMALYLQKKKANKNKFEVYCNSLSTEQQNKAINQIEQEGNVDLDTIQKESFEYKFVNEDVVALEHPDPEVQNVSPDDLKKILIRRYKMRAEKGQFKSTWVWGAPGVAKTDVIKQTAKELGVDLIVWHLSHVEPSDFAGLPKIKEIETGEERTVFVLPKIFPFSNGPNEKGGFLFFDEMNRAKPPVLASALQLSLDGKVDEYSLPSKWIIVAAGNRKEDVPNVTEIEPALSNRFAHVNLITTYEDFEKWALGPYSKDDAGKDRIHPDLLGYFSTNKEYFHYLDVEKEPVAWPSPRSWTAASEEYIQALEESDSESLPTQETVQIFTQYVGKAAALSFANFVQLKNAYPIDKLHMIYDDPNNAPMVPREVDKARGVIIGIAFHKRDIKLTDKEIENAFIYANRITNKEIGITLMGWIKKVHPDIINNKVFQDNARKMASELRS